MKVALLGPFTTSALLPFLPNLTSDECNKFPGMGGTSLTSLAIERIRLGLETTIITLDTELDESSSVVKKYGNVELYILPRRQQKTFRDGYSMEKSKIYSALIDSKPDIINAHWTYDYAISALSYNWDVPLVITVRDHALDVLKYNAYYLPAFLGTIWVFRKAKFITANSPYTANFAGKISRSFPAVIENCISNCLFNENISWDSKISCCGKRKILVLSSWSKLKNPKPAIKAFALLKKNIPEAELHLCGNGFELFGKAYKWVHENKLDKDIFFHGKVKNETIYELLKNSLLLLHTSLTESCSMAIAEAMSLGVPVIGGENSGGVPWQLDFGRAGILANIKDPQEVSNKIQYVFSDKEIWEELSIKSKKRANELYKPEIVVYKYENYYKSISI